MEPICFGLLGLGRFGKHYLRLLQKMPGVKLVAVAAKTQKTIDTLSSSMLSDVLKTTDSNVLLENKEIDCVVIATPCSTHFELASKAIEFGKHVLLEKPMVQNLDEAKKLQATVKKSNSTFIVGHQYLYNDYIDYLNSKIKENYLGKIKFVIAEHLYAGPTRNDVGCFWDAGTHQLSVLHYLLNPGKIVQVSGNSVDIGKKGRDDLTAVTLKFQNGLIASLLVSWFAPCKIRKFTIFGDKKTAVFDDVIKEEKLKFFTEQPLHQNSKTSPFIPQINAKEPLQNELEHFIYCVKNKKSPKTDIDNSYLITEWLDKISKSIKLLEYS